MELMKAVDEHPNLECCIVVTGAHLSKSLGYSIDEIRKKNYNIIGETKGNVDGEYVANACFLNTDGSWKDNYQFINNHHWRSY